MVNRLLVILLLAIAAPAAADVFRPAYLELREARDGEYDVLWKVPALDEDRRLSAYVVFPERTRQLSESRVVVMNGVWLESYRVQREGGFAGETIRIEGNAVGVTDVIARVERLDGSSQVARLPVERPRFVVEAPRGHGEIAWSYLLLGFEHILGGIDHLLFVLALLLIVRGGLRILATITAFTVAHSVTLAAATLGWIDVPGPPVEAVIALSIAFVAGEVLHARHGHPGLTGRAPWIVAFSFGLLHGLGFAGALAEVGLPQVAIPLALFMFNVGVELGQLAFVAAVLAALTVIRRLPAREPAWATVAGAYAIGTVAAYWTIERTAAFWP